MIVPVWGFSAPGSLEWGPVAALLASTEARGPSRSEPPPCATGPTLCDGLRKVWDRLRIDRKSTRLNSSHLVISYAVFCLKKKKTARHELYYREPTVSTTNSLSH